MISQSIASNWSSQQPQYTFQRQRKRGRQVQNDTFTRRVLTLPKRILSCLSGEATGSIQFAAHVHTRCDTSSAHPRTVLLYLEIERCRDLRSLTIFGRLCCPFVVIKLDGKVVGATDPLKATRSPVWHDECFDFPMTSSTSFGGPSLWRRDVMLEVWHMGNDRQVGQCIGTAAFQILSRLDDKPETTTHIFTQNLVTSGVEIDPITYEVRDKALEIQNSNEVQIVPRRLTRIASYLLKPGPRNHTERYTASYTCKFKISNPKPLRRRHCLNDSTKTQEQTMSESTMFRALTLVGLYLLFGVIGFSYVFEKWSIRDSLYFCVVTFTTVGFGDIKPQSSGAKLFSCMYALAGIGIIGIALGYIGQNVVHARMATMQHVQKRLDQLGNEKLDISCASVVDDEEQSLETENYSDLSKKQLSPSHMLKSNTYRSINQTFQSLLLVTPDKPSIWKEAIMTIIPIIIMIFIGSLVVGQNEGWTVVDSIYWCISTGTSVGYGDFAPKTDEMRWFSIFFIPISVGIISAALGRVANGFVEREITKTNEKLLKSELTIEDLERMNVDGDGEVSLLEFVEFMLKSMNKVDQKMLDDLHAQFYRLDADGSGALQEDDLELLTSRKLSEQRKLALEKFENSKLFPVNTPS